MTVFQEPGVYEIRVAAVLDDHWSARFDGMRVARDPSGDTTTIAGRVQDGAALFGILSRICELSLPLVSVRRLDTGGT